MKLRSIFIVVALLGVPAGVGCFTFVYAQGFSYFSAKPNYCINCHIMNEQYDSWLRSGHRHTAVCVDCHLPHAGIEKWISKADQGFRHSMAFTLQNFKEPIEINTRDRDIVLQNCLRCHSQFVHAVYANPIPDGEKIDCLHCHRRPGH